MIIYEKHSPTTLAGFVGNKLSIGKIKEFGAKAQEGNRPKPIMVYGPSGTGKTSALRVLAQTSGFELVELTSSDYRDAETLKKKLLPAVASRGLFAKTTLILFDEIDELSSKFDKGAESVIVQILGEAKQPVAFTAIDFWDQRISFLRNHVDKIEFKKVDMKEIIGLLQKVGRAEGKEVSEEVAREIAYRSDGDVRGALNDLQMVLLGGADILENLGVRNRRLEIFRVLDRIFLTNNFSAARSAIETSETDTGMLINWVEENIPNRYWVKKSVGGAYNELAFASRFFEMAERVRYYGYMKYASIGLAGVSISSGGTMKFLGTYMFPSRIKYLSTTKESRGSQAKIAAKLAPFLHANKHEIISSYLPMFRAIFANMEKGEMERVSESLENDFRLEKEEIAYISGAV